MNIIRAGLGSLSIKETLMFFYLVYANFRYRDCKIYAFNDILFNLGRKHSRYNLCVTSKIYFVT
jgi:hypothetical protein